MVKKRKSPIGVKILALLLMLGSLAAFLLPWMKLCSYVGPNQVRMSPGEIIQNYVGMDAAAVKSEARTAMAAEGLQMDAGVLDDLLDRALNGRFRPHELGILCRDLGALCRAMQRPDLGGTFETAGYAVWGVFGLLALLGLIALISQLTDHRGGIIPYFLLGALITAGLLFLRRGLNNYLLQQSDSLLESFGLSGLFQYLGIDLELVKMGIGAYLSPFLALLAMLFMGIKKKEAPARFQPTPYPARRPAGSAAPAQPRTSVRPAESGAAQRNPAPTVGDQSWVCSYCGKRMSRDKSFCDLCGSPRPRPRPRPVAAAYCGSCGSRLEGDSAFCSNCGAPVKKQSGSVGEETFRFPGEDPV